MTESPLWHRREFLHVGIATTLLSSSMSAGRLALAAERPRFHTPLCDLLGIEYPILQSGMAGVSGPELAAAVSQAGGLGIVAGAHA